MAAKAKSDALAQAAKQAAAKADALKNLAAQGHKADALKDLAKQAGNVPGKPATPQELADAAKALEAARAAAAKKASLLEQIKAAADKAKPPGKP